MYVFQHVAVTVIGGHAIYNILINWYLVPLTGIVLNCLFDWSEVISD